MRSHDPAARRLAESLVDHARMGHRTPKWLSSVPVRQLQDMAAILAEELAEAAPPPNPRDVDNFLRKAHAAFARGQRYRWVRDGERAYQRQVKRRQRARLRDAC